MSNMWNAEETADFLKNHNNYLILTHDNPDGDTLGSAFGLCYALRSIGKNANVIAEEVPDKFSFLTDGYEEMYFTPTKIVAVDMASENMFGEKTKEYVNSVDLCIDHHGSNTRFSKNLFLDEKSAANCENIYTILNRMEIKIDKRIATCLYTGIATDTGCFKFSNVTANTHIFAGTLLSYGVDHAKINFTLFEQKTKEYMAAQQCVIDTLEYYCDGKVAVCAITDEIISKTGVKQSDFDAMVSIPRSIKGVELGATLKARDDGFKVSFRSSQNINASDVASTFGGGGHPRAAGCFIKGSLDEVKNKVVTVCEKAVKEI